MRSRFVGADGSVFEFLPGSYAFEGPWSAVVRVERPLDGRSPDAMRTNELHVARRGNYDYVMLELFKGEVRQRLSAQGGEFIVSRSSEDIDQCVAVWRGPFHEIATYGPNRPDADVSTIIGPLLGLTFQDSADGLVVTPQSGASATVSVMGVFNSVLGVGAVEVKSAAEGIGAVPTWSGAKVPAGELWKVEETEDSGDAHLLLATRSAVVAISPGRAVTGTSSLDEAVAFAEAVESVSVAKGEVKR